MGKSRNHIIKQNLKALHFKTYDFMLQHEMSKSKKEQENIRKALVMSQFVLMNDLKQVNNDQYLSECIERLIDKIESFLKDYDE